MSSRRLSPFRATSSLSIVLYASPSKRAAHAPSLPCSSCQPSSEAQRPTFTSSCEHACYLFTQCRHPYFPTLVLSGSALLLCKGESSAHVRRYCALTRVTAPPGSLLEYTHDLAQLPGAYRAALSRAHRRVHHSVQECWHARRDGNRNHLHSIPDKAPKHYRVGYSCLW